MPDTIVTNPPSQRRATNVTLPVALVAEAKALKVNVSQACEVGLVVAVKAARENRWVEQNRDAIAAYNERIEREGLILDEYRLP